MTIGVRKLQKYVAARKTVLQIVGSQHVREFCVGITGDATSRRRAYARWCRQHEACLDGFVILDWDQTPDDVVAFEHWLFEQVCSHRKYSNVENVKYFPNVNRRFERQVIYVAWWSPPFVGLG